MMDSSTYHRFDAQALGYQEKCDLYLLTIGALLLSKIIQPHEY
jgi:hypothetical protein